MSSGKPIRDSSPKLDDVVDLGSIPPPPGVVGPDVHAARTAIAAMPSSLLEELRRAKQADNAEGNRTRKQEKFELPSLAKRGHSFTNEAPTAPGKDGMRLLRPLAPDVDDIPPPAPSEDLVSAVTEAMAKASMEEVRSAETLPAPPSPPSPPLAPSPIEAFPKQAAVLRTPPMPTPAPVIAPPIAAPIAAPTAGPMAPSNVPPIKTPFNATPFDARPAIAIMAEQIPAAVPMIDTRPHEPERPLVRIQFLIALVIAIAAGLVLAMIAIAERFPIQR